MGDIYRAAEAGNIAMVRVWIKKGADVNKPAGREKLTPLLWAARGGHIDTMQELLGAGADIAAQDVKGNTALHYACLNNHAESTQMLIEMGSDIHWKNKAKKMPLQLAKWEFVDDNFIAPLRDELDELTEEGMRQNRLRAVAEERADRARRATADANANAEAAKRRLEEDVDAEKNIQKRLNAMKKMQAEAEKSTALFKKETAKLEVQIRQAEHARRDCVGQIEAFAASERANVGIIARLVKEKEAIDKKTASIREKIDCKSGLLEAVHIYQKAMRAREGEEEVYDEDLDERVMRTRMFTPLPNDERQNGRSVRRRCAEFTMVTAQAVITMFTLDTTDLVMASLMIENGVRVFVEAFLRHPKHPGIATLSLDILQTLLHFEPTENILRVHHAFEDCTDHGMVKRGPPAKQVLNTVWNTMLRYGHEADVISAACKFLWEYHQATRIPKAPGGKRSSVGNSKTAKLGARINRARMEKAAMDATAAEVKLLVSMLGTLRNSRELLVQTYEADGIHGGLTWDVTVKARGGACGGFKAPPPRKQRGVKRRHGPQSYTYDEGLFACEELLMVCGVQLEEFD